MLGPVDVASRAEAWIETGRSSGRVEPRSVASRAEAWIETMPGLSYLSASSGRLPRGGVD